MPVRTDQQKLADDFDMKLFDLISTAEREAEEFGRWNRGPNPWQKVATALRDARPHVRGMMHADDRRETA